MAYRFQVNDETCINCGICMDLRPVRCLDMTRPAGEGEIDQEQKLRSPIPGNSVILFPGCHDTHPCRSRSSNAPDLS